MESLQDELKLIENGCCEFMPPDWLGNEVTGRSRYRNVVLAQE